MSSQLPLHAARLVVRAAALGVPPDPRRRMVREWDGELAEEAERVGGWSALKAAWGAFADAGALRAETTLEGGTRGRWTMGGWTSGWRADLGVAMRGLRRTPGFTAVAVATLALGIGGSAAIFTLLDRAVLEPLPYPDASRLVRLDNQVPGVGPNEVWGLSTAQMVYFTDHAQSFDAVGIGRGSAGTVVTPEGARRVVTVLVTQSMMGLLGAKARLGRLITPGDDHPSAPAVALLSEGFWKRELGADSSVVGTALTYDDQPVEIIGVMAGDVRLPGWVSTTPDLWLPMRIDRNGPFYNHHVFSGIARLAPGVSLAGAKEEMVRLTAELPAAFPGVYPQSFMNRYGFRTEVKPLKDDVLGDLERNLWIVFGGVALVLLIAAANVANLFIVRMESRRREMGIRSALGAGRPAITRYVLSESMTLALLGGLVALLVAYWGVPALTALAPSDLARIHDAQVGLATLAFTLGLSLLVGLGIAAYPLFRHSGPRVTDALSEGGRSFSVGRSRQRVRSGLVVAQVTLALTLSVAAMLLTKTLQGLREKNVGFQPRAVLAANLFLSRQRYPDDMAVWNFYQDVLERIRGIPGVVTTALGEEVPVAGGYGCTVQGFEDQAVYARIEETGLTTCAGEERVTPDYFRTLGIPLLEGRALSDADNDDPTRGAVVVSKAFADRFWPGEDALGKGVGPSGQKTGPFYHVVGVVGDVPGSSEAGRPPLSQTAMAIYYPIRHDPEAPLTSGWWPGYMTLVVKAGVSDPVTLFPSIRRAVAQADPQIPLAELTDMATVVRQATATIAFVALMLGIAAGVAMGLSAVGLYGVVSYVVSRRTREIGMRMAIGARPGEVQRLVVGGSLAMVGTGLVLGLGLAMASTMLLRNLLVGVTSTDPAAYAAASGALAAVAVVASWLPARRASRVDPVEALRAD